ncbi:MULTISPECIES: hypothetical protein [unclassified Brevundimonas]|uniref:hypothetical protein n=1 Tax=unclassified Brevundimonas TaxID=2622653 RepID=UPI000CFA92DC|nr:MULTISPECIES: hypothetical protein [unclassified Brevundimonas]PRA31997.1 hypothetical protein CQ024_06015 [Brevundimonas sp. MYb27]PQZ82737.1 hypothetical protein CQ026_08240 [Brevundimonas sp. MYb31]PRB16977.1 hypothetical protein CQ039_04890 [Brevundimonas sp. MYb52]PRB37308.1 hypothetical protein CQ035_03105 [Brevundimonas sp. MYb46]PRB54812.1 hypothetical protein CQ028_03230 [Brevundimonas sp. MYb33]
MKQAVVMMIALAAPLLASACAPYEADPVSVYQWERKVEQVQRQEAERLRVCGTLDKESARYQRECAGVKS